MAKKGKYSSMRNVRKLGKPGIRAHASNPGSGTTSDVVSRPRLRKYTRAGKGPIKGAAV